MEQSGDTAVKLTSGALVIAVFSVASRLLGVLRDRLLAAHFGAGAVLDAYYAAFKIPDFIFNIFVLGALASAFIPVFIRLRNKEGRPAAWHVAQSVFNLLVSLLIVLALLGIVLAPWLMPAIAPGFEAERLQLAISLTRVMLIAIVLFGASNVIGSVLQAEQRFLSYSLAAVLYNLGIIIGLLTFVRAWGPVGLAWGVVWGSLLHLLVQVPAAWRIGFRWRAVWSLSNRGVREVLRLLGPRTIGLAASSVEQIITAGFVSTLGVGSLAAFALASNLQSFPINVFGVSLAVAAFPIFSQAWAVGNHDHFINHFKESVRRIVFFVLPMSVLFLVLRAQVVRVVLGSGAFDWVATARTAQVLGFLALAMLADALVPLVARAFYALSDTRTPALVALGSVVLNVVLLLSLYQFGLTGIGLAYVLSRLLSLTMLLILLTKRLGSLGADYIIRGVRVMLGAAVAAGAAAYVTLWLVLPYVNQHTFVGIFIQGVAAGSVGVLCYFVLAMYAKLPEVEFVERWSGSAWRLTKRLWNRA